MKQKIAIVKAFNDGKPAKELAQENGLHFSTINGWARKLNDKAPKKPKIIAEHYPEPTAPKEANPPAKRLAALEKENELLKRMYGDLSIKYAILQESIGRKS